MAKFGQIVNVAVTNPRQILRSESLLVKPSSGATVAANSNKVQAGTFLTFNSGTNYFFMTKVTKVSNAQLDTGAAFTLSTTQAVFTNPFPFVVGDTITIGGTNTTISAINYVTGVVTYTAMAGAPANGARVASQTAGNNQVDCIALNELPADVVDQVTEVAIMGIFRQDMLEQFYHTDDIQKVNTASTTGLGAVLKSPFQAYILRG